MSPFTAGECALYGGYARKGQNDWLEWPLFPHLTYPDCNDDCCHLHVVVESAQQHIMCCGSQKVNIRVGKEASGKTRASPAALQDKINLH